jgi:drug/metabolite transporter (DMT)-like permease
MDDVPLSIRIVVIVSWLVLNLGLNFYNKWAFTPAEDPSPENPGFSFPIFYTLWNMVASFFGACLVMSLVAETRTLSRKQAWENKWSLFILHILFVMNILTQNAALVHIGLSINQILKCCVPLPTMLCAYFIQNTKYPYPIIVAAVAVVTGAMLSVPFMDPTVTTIGLALTSASTVCAAARPVISALILNNAKETGLTPIPLLWYDSLLSIFTLLIMFFLSNESPTLPEYYHTYPRMGVVIVFVGSAMAFTFNVVTFYLIKQIGPLTSTLLGNLKTIILVLVAAAVVDTAQLSPLNIFGYVFFFCALFTYSYLNLLKSQNRLRYPPCPFPCCCEEPGDGQGPLPPDAPTGCCWCLSRPAKAEVTPAQEPSQPATEQSKLIGK